MLSVSKVIGKVEIHVCFIDFFSQSARSKVTKTALQTYTGIRGTLEGQEKKRHQRLCQSDRRGHQLLWTMRFSRRRQAWTLIVRVPGYQLCPQATQTLHPVSSSTAHCQLIS